MSVTVAGTCSPEFAPVRAAFQSCFDELDELGAAVAVVHDGRLAIDLWGGWTDPGRNRPWTGDTLVNVYSVSKPLVAACVLRLIERGELALDAPVAECWPEFAQAGKGDLPLRWLLTHQSGVVAIDAPAPTSLLYDWDRAVAELAAATPAWPPGTALGEQAMWFGHLVGELIRRRTGRTVGQFWREEIGDPLGCDFHFGLGPAEQARTADLALAHYHATQPRPTPGSLGDRARNNPPGLLDPAVVNSAAWRSAEIPAVNGHGSARALARFYGALSRDGSLDGVQVLAPETLELALTRHASGRDQVMGFESEWGLGFHRSDTGGFGLGGLGGSWGGGNRKTRVGVGFVHNRLDGFESCDRVAEALQECLGHDL